MIPSLLQIPSAVSDSKLHSVLPNNGKGDFQFERSSTATRINRDGLIETVATEIPRLSYDITNGVVEDKPHLLLEPSSTNLVVNSNASFVTNGTSISYNNITSPDGIQNGFKVQSTTTGTAVFVRTDNISFTDPVTFSVFVKYGNNQWLQFLDSYSSSHYFNFDVQNGVFGTSAGGTTNLKAVKFANGWYRVSGTFTGVSVSVGFRIYVNDRTDAAYGSAVSSAIGQYFYAFGWQVENLAFSTSYIPTAGTTITRAAETCNNSKPSVNSTEGVLYAEIKGDEDGGNRFIAMSNGDITNCVRIIFLSNNIIGQVRAGGSEVFYIATSGISIEQYNKIAVSYKLNQCKLFVNGSQVGLTDTSAAAPTGLNTLEFAEGDGANDFYGKVKGLAVYNEALTDAQLQTLTT